jgi:hypothetical protein
MNAKRSLTVEHMDPWNGNIVDMEMLDGAHLTGLLERVDADWVRLKNVDGSKRPSDGLVRIADATKIARASRN